MMKINSEIIKAICLTEGVEPDVLKKKVSEGRVVIPCNLKRKIDRPMAVGEGLKTKVNANIGLSKGHSGMDEELKKMEVAIGAGADAIMDLSTGALLNKVRKKILENSPVPVGTVPVYELACGDNRDFKSLREKDFIEILEGQAEEGVDFFTIHAGITLEAVKYAMDNPRIMNIVSRGGALLASWMYMNNKENPYFTRYDDVLKILKKYNVTLSLGDSLRPGSVRDATDHLQISELLVLGDLQKRALGSGVQVMIEGPGHMPLDQIEANVKLEKLICHGAPFYVLGPLVTDIAPGYDHIVSAIGGAIAAWHGADFICYVTPAEHLGLPDLGEVKQGVIAARIAAHAADIAKGVKSALDRDINISKARARRDWKEQFRLAIDPELPFMVRKRTNPSEEDVCSMCEDLCSIKRTEEILKFKKEK
ncbi:MAG: phosphomethylpyrimidine synthase ThiC [Candidatus Omnitrophica bacterium]|nr:phosphomethylpyrimidine synthase ThiC [Candidatus Omnitrophota bacterium]